MHTPILEPVQITKSVKYFRGESTKTFNRCLRFILKAKDADRFISAGTRYYGGQNVLYVNYKLR
jgi:hypothetical protein